MHFPISPKTMADNDAIEDASLSPSATALASDNSDAAEDVNRELGKIIRGESWQKKTIQTANATWQTLVFASGWPWRRATTHCSSVAELDTLHGDELRCYRAIFQVDLIPNTLDASSASYCLAVKLKTIACTALRGAYCEHIKFEGSGARTAAGEQ